MAVRLALLTLPSVVAGAVGVSINLQGAAPQVRISSTGGPPGMYPGHFEMEVFLDVFGRGGVQNLPAPPDDGTASRIAYDLCRDVESIKDKIPTAFGEVAHLHAERFPAEAEEQQTDRPQWTCALRAHVFDN